MLLKVSLLMYWVALCCAQPLLSETFTSSFTITIRTRGREENGNGIWDRSSGTKRFIRKDIVEGDRVFLDEHLANYNTHKDYRVNVDPTGKLQCHVGEIPPEAEFPVYWDWLKDSQRREYKDPRTNKTYTAWEERSDRGLRRLLIDEAKPTEPVALMEERNGFEQDMRFLVFAPTEPPPPSPFAVPRECDPPTQQQEHHH